jgi:ribosome-associated translation inhibitor RaiA
VLPVQITMHNAELPAAAAADIEARAAHLAHYYPRIESCRVTIDVPQGRHRTDAARYAVRIDLQVPGDDIVVTRQPRRAFATALDEAFRAARRRLQDHARRLRGAVKAHERSDPSP